MRRYMRGSGEEDETPLLLSIGYAVGHIQYNV